VLLRPGQISRTELAQVCKQPVLLNEELPEHVLRGQSTAPKASGTLASHYAPNAKVRLMNAKQLQAALHVLGNELDARPPTIAVYARAVLKSSSSRILRRRMPDDAAATAHQLFAVLREFDAQGMKLIWVETPPDDVDWDGVRDRLQRAAAA
jgi:L-threonylcarbamoyladenylate synthase